MEGRADHCDRGRQGVDRRGRSVCHHAGGHRAERRGAQQVRHQHHADAREPVAEDRRERRCECGREPADEPDETDRGGAALVERVHDERDRVRPAADDRAGPGQLQPAQAAVAEDVAHRARRLAQVFPKPLHKRRIAGTIAFLKMAWKISWTNSVR
jgi:hypothetical protein